MRNLVILLCLLLASCTLDNAIRAANTAAELGDRVEKTLAETYKKEQVDAIDHSENVEQAKLAVSEIRKKYAPAWAAYSAFHRAWLALRGVILAVQAGQDGDLNAALVALVAAQKGLIVP